MKTTVKVDGLRELDASLQALADEYGKAAGKGVLVINFFVIKATA